MRSTRIQRDLYFIENNQIMAANVFHGLKEIVKISPLFKKLHSLVVLDHDKPDIYATDSLSGKIVNLNDSKVTEIKTSGDILKHPGGILYDKVKDIFYVVNTGSHCICTMDRKNGTIKTIVGTREQSGYKDGYGTKILFNSPVGISFGKTADFLYITDTGNHVIRKVDIQNNYKTTTIGVHQTRSPSVSDGISKTSMFRSPVDILQTNYGTLIICEMNGNLRELVIDTHVTRTLYLPCQLARTRTRIVQNPSSKTLSFLIHNNSEWYHVFTDQTNQTVCQKKEKQIHHPGLFFDKYNNLRIIKQPYYLSYSPPQNPSKRTKLYDDWWNVQGLTSQYDYHNANLGNHIPYLSDGRIPEEMNDIFMYPHEKTPKLLNLEMRFLRNVTGDSAYSYLIETEYGYEGRIKIKHKESTNPLTHIIRLETTPINGEWTVSIHPGLNDPQKVELMGGPEGLFESNNYVSNGIGSWEDNSELIGNIRQWSEKYKKQKPIHKPVSNLYELSCNDKTCNYSNLRKAPECCSGKNKSICHKESTTGKQYNQSGICQCRDGYSSRSCQIMRGQTKQSTWEKCNQCDNGYESRNSGICSMKCHCSHGREATGYMCYNPGTQICSKCDPGYMMDSDNICYKNTNYTGPKQTLSNLPLQETKKHWGDNFFSWNLMDSKVSKKPDGTDWTQSPSKPDMCLEKPGSNEKRIADPIQKTSLFNQECWVPKVNDTCYQSIVKGINKNNEPTTSKLFRKEQCKQSIDSKSPCFQKVPCGLDTLGQTTDCLSPSETISILKPLEPSKTYTDKDLLGKTQWIVTDGNVRKKGYEIELHIRDYQPGAQTKQISHLCNDSPGHTVQKLAVTGFHGDKCNHRELLANDIYNRDSEITNKVIFRNKTGYELQINKSDPCLSSVYQKKCSNNPLIQYKGQTIGVSGCDQPSVVSHSVNDDDCKRCSHWSYIQEQNIQTDANIRDSIFSSSTSSIVNAIHIRLPTTFPRVSSNTCTDDRFIREIIEGDYIKRSLFKTINKVTHVKDIVPIGPDEGMYNRSHQIGIQSILSEGSEYFFEKKLKLTKTYQCQKLTIPKTGPDIIVRISYCHDDHWRITSTSHGDISITGNLWDPKRSRYPQNQCDIEYRRRDPKQLRSLNETMKQTHLLDLQVRHKNIILVNIKGDAMTPMESEICEPDLVLVVPKFTRTNKQVRQELRNVSLDTLGYYIRRNSINYLLNPYSPLDGEILRHTNMNEIPMYSSSKCNRIASEVYDTRSDNECRKLRIPDITQLRTPILSDCIQKWGKNTESNGTKLFINDQWTSLSKPYQPDISQGERCCQADTSRNESICIQKDNGSRYHVCKDGFHLVDEKEHQINPGKATNHTNDNHCETNRCKCVPNRCRCLLGNKTPKVGADCLIHDSVSCYDGCPIYKYRKNRQCVPNICRCGVSFQGETHPPGWTKKNNTYDHSFPSSASTRCHVHDANECDKCPLGFYLKNKQCQPFSGGCRNGELVSQLDRRMKDQCGKCRSGYELMKQTVTGVKNKATEQECLRIPSGGNPCVCHPKPCQVSSTSNSQMGDCLSVLDSGKDCKLKCNTGYSLSDPSTCDKGILKSGSCFKNTCSCESGIPYSGTECTKDGEVSCMSCDPGYEHDSLSRTCTPHIGNCRHGNLLKQSLRKQENQCGDCDDGYYLSKGSCLRFPQCKQGEELKGWNPGGQGMDGIGGSCKSCPQETYRLKGGDHKTKCFPQPKCPTNQYEEVKGDTTKKRICKQRLTCSYPSNTKGYLINKRVSNISMDESSTFNVSVKCDTKQNFKPDKQMGGRPCIFNNTPIELFGCHQWCPISPSQHANTGTCGDSLRIQEKCRFECPTGTCPDKLNTFHRCRDGKLLAGSCSKEACIKLLDAEGKKQEDANKRIKQRIAPLRHLGWNAGVRSIPKEVNQMG